METSNAWCVPPSSCSISTWLDSTGHFSVWITHRHVQWGVAFGITMVPHLFDITLSPAQELGAGLAVAFLVSLNLGKDFNRQGCLFLVSEDTLHLWCGRGRKSCPYRLLLFTAVLWANDSSLYSSCTDDWKLVSLRGIYSLQRQEHFVHPSVILVLQIVLLPLYLLEMQCNMIEVVFFGGFHVWFVLTHDLTQLKSWAGVPGLLGVCEKRNIFQVCKRRSNFIGLW